MAVANLPAKIPFFFHEDNTVDPQFVVSFTNFTLGGILLYVIFWRVIPDYRTDADRSRAEFMATIDLLTTKLLEEKRAARTEYIESVRQLSTEAIARMDAVVSHLGEKIQGIDQAARQYGEVLRLLGEILRKNGVPPPAAPDQPHQ